MNHDQPPLKLAIIDDHQSITSLLVEALNSVDGFEVVGFGSNGAEAIALCSEKKPDVLLLDAMLPDVNGIDCVKQIRKCSPGTKILIFTGNANAILVGKAMELRVEGYVEKSSRLQEVIAAIQAVGNGASYYGRTATQKVNQIQRSPFPLDASSNLTARERSILAGVAMGKSSKVIAAELNLSPFTVNNHRRRIKNKTGLSTISDLTLHALNVGLIEDPGYNVSGKTSPNKPGGQ